MKTTTKPTATAPHFSPQYLTSLLNLGVLALELWRAEMAQKNAHAVYITRVQAAVRLYGPYEGRLSPDNPAHAKIIKHSAEKFARYKDAKRVVYNIKRRMATASQNAARVAAEKGGAK